MLMRTMFVLRSSWSAHGGLAVSISKTRQPRLQMSACRPCPLPVTTSGAMKKGVPLNEQFAWSACSGAPCQQPRRPTTCCS